MQSRLQAADGYAPAGRAPWVSADPEFYLARNVCIGTDFTGLNSLVLSAQNVLRIRNAIDVFSCETDPAVRRMIDTTPTVRAPEYTCYGNIRERTVSTMPSVDVFMTTPSCVPFSRNGKRMPSQHEDVDHVFFSLEYVQLHRPTVVIFENVADIVSCPAVFSTIHDALDSYGYM